MSEYEMLLIFEQFSMEYVEKSWEWLNDSEIRQLTDTLVFTKEDQLVWYESLPTKKDYRVWGISITGEKIGVVGLKKITKDSAEFFTYIGEKKYWGKGLGVQILSFAEEQARKLKLV
jgi:RimJ/RimL family protein N-acetyltransferase